MAPERVTHRAMTSVTPSRRSSLDELAERFEAGRVDVVDCLGI
jgi:hypothetical protein